MHGYRSSSGAAASSSSHPDAWHPPGPATLSTEDARPAHYSLSSSHASTAHDPLQWRTYTLSAHLNYPFDLPPCRGSNTSDLYTVPLETTTPSPSSRWASAPTSSRNTPSPSPNAMRRSSQSQTFSIAVSRSRAKSEEIPDNVKVCTHCFVTSTPLWRKHPDTKQVLCNACGLYVLEHGKLRPPELIESDNRDEDNEEEDSQGADHCGTISGKECSHCGSRSTSTWRRDKETKELLCNACGVYLQLRGEKRPLRLKKNKFKPRPSKLSPAPVPEVRVFHW